MENQKQVSHFPTAISYVRKPERKTGGLRPPPCAAAFRPASANDVYHSVTLSNEATRKSNCRRTRYDLIGGCNRLGVARACRKGKKIRMAVEQRTNPIMGKRAEDAYTEWPSYNRKGGSRFLYDRKGRVSHLPGLRRTPSADDGRRAGCGKSARLVR